ncbi:MAG: GtrA family protein [Micropruina sp.]|uniref:GtrA family protein n=1 Tax=Micropruina sp. TaxID=2737536 RepID=UPI0039E65EAF
MHNDGPSATDGPAALWFRNFTGGIHRALPAALRRVVPLTFIGYAIINGSAFVLDMGVLMGLDKALAITAEGLKSAPWITGAVFSFGYAIAAVYAFILNRWLNFREHGDLGKQSWKYTAVMISNYLIWIWAVATLLTTSGMPLPVARVTVACCEGIYIYLLLRLWVFPKSRRQESADDTDPDSTDPEQTIPRNSPVG